ncbi:MAG: thermonuclease family protein, partial [Candidatus Pacearchaeota archaeon]|nr:thermonuclease family protein [Candidatus Pacearchaeota archaeon]
MGQPKTSQRILEAATIVEVIDGDTVKTSNNETIRLLHVNTPEKGEECYQEAKNRLRELVENKTVWLERDMQDKDKYGRKLRYLFLDYNTDLHNYEGFVNLMLVREGYASWLIIKPNMKYKPAFEEAMAKAEGCLFERSKFSGCFLIEQFHSDAQDDDCNNANDEYIILRNSCEDMNMQGWTIKDSSRKIYTFKKFTAKKDVPFTLHSGSGIDNETDLFWNLNLSCPAIWNNDHDTLFLRDVEDKLALY